MTTIAEAPARAVLLNRDFRFLLVGRFLSTLNVLMLSVTVAWQIYDVTSDPLALGYAGLAAFVPVAIFGLPAGNLADRLDRRLILVGSLSVDILCAAFLLWITWVGTTVAWPFFIGLFIHSTARTMYGPAMQSMIPLIVPPAQLSTAMALQSSVGQTAQILGPAVAGGLLLAGADTVYESCLALCAIAVVLFALIRTSGRSRQGEPGLGPWVRLRAGLAYVRRNPFLYGAISLDLFAVLLGTTMALLPVYARDILHVGPDGLGWLRAAPAIGAVSTALVLAHIGGLRHSGAWMFGAVAVFGAATVVFGLSTSMILSVTALAVSGAADMVSMYVRNTMVQLATPDGMRGRVTAVHLLCTGTSNYLGDYRTGLAASWLGAMPAAVVGGVTSIVVAVLWSAWFPQLRKIDRVTDVAPTGG